MDEIEYYEDEPMTSVRPKEFSGTQLVIENMEEVDRKRAQRRRRRRRRLENLGRFVVALTCIAVIIIVVVVTLLTEATIAVTHVTPTIAPTVMPAIPTYKPTDFHPTPTTKVPTTPAPVLPTTPAPVTPPTAPPLVDELVLSPIQDGFVFLNGPDATRAFGKQDTFLVQKGFRTNDDIGDAIGLLIFDTSSLPSFDQLATDGKRAVLRLYHQPLDITAQDREPAPITVVRMASIAPGMTIETMDGDSFPFKVTDGQDGPSFTVATTAAEVEVDITDLFFGAEPEGNQLFLILETRDQEQSEGDHFYSREKLEDPKEPGAPPELRLTGLLA